MEVCGNHTYLQRVSSVGVQQLVPVSQNAQSGRSKLRNFYFLCVAADCFLWRRSQLVYGVYLQTYFT